MFGSDGQEAISLLPFLSFLVQVSTRWTLIPVFVERTSYVNTSEYNTKGYYK